VGGPASGALERVEYGQNFTARDLLAIDIQQDARYKTEEAREFLGSDGLRHRYDAPRIDGRFIQRVCAGGEAGPACPIRSRPIVRCSDLLPIGARIFQDAIGQV